MPSSQTEPIWIARDFYNCSGCRMCEVVCTLHHEGRIWPEASRIRVFMLIPTLEIPHLCAQCHDYPCVEACPTEPKALSVDDITGAVIVDRELCISCGQCIEACPGDVPFLHPGDNKATICDLCGGDPECVKICQKGKWNALWLAKRSPSINYKLYAENPSKIVKDMAFRLYREKAEELI
ncbi:MAG: 4Fe-4S dicluster domain-containing protein [Thermoproteota archaeon]|nr:MAG: 4Fe-4S dicluster domain-containing protein [Candidatus Korarchaeota archaeon]